MAVAEAIGLILAPAFGERGSFVPLGLASLNGALREAGFEPEFHDVSAEVRLHEPELYARLSHVGFSPGQGGFFGPDLGLLLSLGRPEAVGVTPLAQAIRASARARAQNLQSLELALVTLWDSNVYYALELGRCLREFGVYVAMGGPGAQVRAVRELLLRLGAADAILVGEGEERVVALARDPASARHMAGSAFLDGAGTSYVETAPALPLKIASLPRPSFEGFGAHEWLPIITSRGCIRDCSFCTESFFWTRYRQRPVEQVFAELAFQMERWGGRRFEFNDDLLNGHPRWLESLCDGLVERGWGLDWICFMEPYRLSPALLDKLARAGCTLVKYGVQHFHPAMLRVMGRGEGVEGVVDTLLATAERGMRVDFDLVPGHPGELTAYHETNLRLLPVVLSQNSALHANINPFLLLYGSPVERTPAQFGVVIQRASATDYPPAVAEELGELLEQFITGYAQEPVRAVVAERAAELEALVAAAKGATLPVVQPRGDSGAPSAALPRSGWNVVRPAPGHTPRQILDAVAERASAGAGVVVEITGAPLDRASFIKRLAMAGGRVAVVAHGISGEQHDRVVGMCRQVGLWTWVRLEPSADELVTVPATLARALRAGAQVVVLELDTAQRGPDGASLSQVAQLARSALTAGRAAGVPVLVHGVPFCLASGEDARMLDRPLASRDAAPHVAWEQPARCRACRLSARCPGLLRDVLERDGDSMLRPLPGRPQQGEHSPLWHILHQAPAPLASPRAESAP